MDKIILVSDVSMYGGMEPGVYKWGNIDVEVFRDGHLGLAGTEYLAGAGHLLNHSLAWLMNELNLSPGEAVTLCTVNPHKLFFPKETVPGLKPGDPADLTLFNWKRGDTQIETLATWGQGKKVHSVS